MKIKNEQAPDREIEQYQDLLNLSCKHIKPSVKAQLDDSRRLAIEQSTNKSTFLNSIWQPAMVLFIPAFLLVGLLFQTPGNIEQPAVVTDIYSDLELLEDEDQLEFLAELDVSQWLIDENDS